jgi:hypothetical protein
MTPHLLAHSFYMQNLTFGAVFGSVNPVAWSLEIEVQFYVLVPLLSLMFSIGDARLRRIAILLGMLITSLLSIPLYRSMHLHYSILYYCPFFLAGFLLCDRYLTRGEWRTSFIWDAAICLWPFVWLMSRNVGHVLLPLLIVVLYLSAFRGRISSAIFSHPVINQHRRDVLSHLPFPSPDYLYEALDRADSHRRELLVLFHLAVLLHLARRAAFLRDFLCPDRAPLHGPGMAQESLASGANVAYWQEPSNPNLEKLSIRSFAHSSLITEVRRFSYSADA